MAAARQPVAPREQGLEGVIEQVDAVVVTRADLGKCRVIEDVFTPEQKRRIVEELTDAMVAIEGESMRQVTWVVVEEVRSGDWGIAGRPLTTQDVRALAAAPA